ncbi:MAG: hypothetical protein ACREOJ_13640, partial [Gemmatimonadaceae bacterium]
MKVVSVNSAIASGEWLKFNTSYLGMQMKFRLRLVDFHRIDDQEITRTIEVDTLIEGALWLLSVEVINLGQQPVSAYRVAKT